MSKHLRLINGKKLKTYLFIIIFWVFNINMVSIIALTSVHSFLSYIHLDIQSINDPMAIYFISNKQIIESFIFSLMTAVLFILVNELAEKMKWDKYSFGNIILRKSVFYVTGFVIIFYLTYQVLVNFGFYEGLDFHQIEFTTPMISTFLLISLYMIFLVILLNFILQTTKKVGENTLMNFLSGKYHVPIIEEKIFLFMDLKSSTMYAEKLGNLKYSSLIKDCFDDMNFIVEKYDAEIYQYVGDEIVLTWDMKKGLDNLNFISVFFSFQKMLQKRKAYYLDKYGLLPEFKAGANGGAISVAEVGNFKREIAFHGDVINTASRIESICNKYNENFLVSGPLIEKVDLNGYTSKHLGNIQLRGKEKPLDIYAINN